MDVEATFQVEPLMTSLSANKKWLPSILKTHFQEKSLVPADSSPVILVMLEMRLK